MALRNSRPHAVCFPGPEGRHHLNAPPLPPTFSKCPARQPLRYLPLLCPSSLSSCPPPHPPPHDRMEGSWALESDRPRLLPYLITSCVAWSKSLNLSETEMLHTWNGIHNTCLNRPVHLVGSLSDTKMKPC